MDNANKKTPEDPRVRFAGERTLLAWIRTGLAMMGFGFVVARFGLFLREIASVRSESPISPHSFRSSLWIGAGLIVLGMAVNLIAASQHVHFLRRLQSGLDYEPPKWPQAVIVAVILSIIGLGMVVYLIWLS